MEERMDRVGKWVRSLSRTLEEQLSVQEDFFELSSYYESDLWMEDYEADEAGELPPDLKRGVLSEDGLFNLLTEYEDLLRRLKNLGGTR